MGDTWVNLGYTDCLLSPYQPPDEPLNSSVLGINAVVFTSCFQSLSFFVFITRLFTVDADSPLLLKKSTASVLGSWCTLFITECAWCTSPTRFLPSPTTRHDPVCAVPTARCIGYRDVVRPWASVHSPSLAHSRGMLSVQPSMTLLTHVFQKTSQNTLF